MLVLASCMSVMAGAVLGGAAASGSLSEQEELVSSATSNLYHDLTNYVTADASPVWPCGGSGERPCPPPVSTCRGPELADCVLAQWRLPGDTSGGWALAEGTHDASGRLPPRLAGAPYNARMTYRVTAAQVNGRTSHGVEVEVRWNSPAS